MSETGPPTRDSVEWTSAWATISRLAADRQVAMHERSLARAPILESRPVQDGAQIGLNVTRSIDQSQPDCAIAEIEEASATLKSVEPALVPWHPDAVVAPRKPRSVWLLIGTIWIATALVVASLVGTIGYLVN